MSVLVKCPIETCIAGTNRRPNDGEIHCWLCVDRNQVFVEVAAAYRLGGIRAVWALEANNDEIYAYRHRHV